mgnify:CR=1 FL=1
MLGEVDPSAPAESILGLDPAIADEDTVDNIASNYRVTRREGSTAGGAVTVIVDTLAVVAGDVAAANVVVPGPLCCVHWLVTVAPTGRPSSLTVPARVAPAGSVIV